MSGDWPTYKQVLTAAEIEPQRLGDMSAFFPQEHFLPAELLTDLHRAILLRSKFWHFSGETSIFLDWMLFSPPKDVDQMFRMLTPHRV